MKVTFILFYLAENQWDVILRLLSICGLEPRKLLETVKAPQSWYELPQPPFHVQLILETHKCIQPRLLPAACNCACMVALVIYLTINTETSHMALDISLPTVDSSASFLNWCVCCSSFLLDHIYVEVASADSWKPLRSRHKSCFLISTRCWSDDIFSVCVRVCERMNAVSVLVFEDGEVLLWLKVGLTLYHCYHRVEQLCIFNMNRFLKSRKHQWDCMIWLPRFSRKGGWG